MLTKETLRYYAGPILFILMLVDGQFTRLIDNAVGDAYIANSHLLILALICACYQLSSRYMIITSVILGVLYDLYYIGVVGINALAFPVIVLAMYGVYRVLYENVFTMFFGMIIFITAYEIITLGIQLLFHMADVSNTYFITQFLGPTLLLNMALFVVLIIPFRKLFIVEKTFG